MPFDISKYAKGVPSLLGLKDRGRGIPFLADSVVGTINVRDLYLLDTREYLEQAALAIAGVGPQYFTNLRVPPGELWYVWEFSVSSSPGAGAAVDVAAAYNAEGLPQLANVGPYTAIAATQNGVSSSLRPFWAGAGTAFAGNVRSFTLAPTLYCGLLLTRLKI